MIWAVLIFAGLLEVAGAIALKYSEGFTRHSFTALTLAFFATSFYLLSSVAAVLPIGTAYAVWTGVGAAGTALVGMAVFAEPRTAFRVASLALIILGSAGVKLFS
jgi:quaternary ammonium compound-resistance protein SugE